MFTKDRREVWVLIHIEIQGYADRHFNRRMFRYHYRLCDRYPERDIASFAVLTNQKSDRKLGHYQKTFWQTENSFKFPLANLQADWAGRMEVLEADPNPFALVVLAQLMAHNFKDSQQRFDGKFRLIRQLYRRGYDKQQVLNLFRFIDWMLHLPQELELQLTHEIIRIEEEEKMPYVTSIERFAIEKGRAEGKAEGRVEGKAEGKTEGEAYTLLKQIRLKFGQFSEAVEKKVISAEPSQLDRWVERILTADSLESLFKED